MADTNFQSRLARLESNAQVKFNEQQLASQFPKSRNRKEKLAIALAHLERGGVKGSYAYAPLFQVCARAGCIMRPLHYRSWLGLIAFFMGTVICIAILSLVLTVVFQTMPRPVRGMIDAGPVVFFGGAFALSVVFAAIHRFKARQIGLPRWSDI